VLLLARQASVERVTYTSDATRPQHHKPYPRPEIHSISRQHLGGCDKPETPLTLSDHSILVATMTLLSGLHSHRSTEQQAEIREARRMLQGRVRTDWDYPALPQYQHTKPRQQNEASKVAGFKFHAPRADEHFEPLEWRERDYASSDADSEEDENEIAAVKAGAEKSMFSGGQKSKDVASIAEDISNRRLARKRKRKELLEEEMLWNDGLNHWTIRRDAWCVAKTAEQVRELESRQGEDVKAGSATSSASAQAASTSTSATSPDANTSAVGMSVAQPSHMLIPVMAKILPHHPIRKKISPAMYPEIYNKIIVQARTPSVPINLSVMIWALVQGWIDDGEWPPKPGPIEKSLTKKKGHGGVKDGVKSFARILRITGGDSTVAKG
jgi:hypothetical protein